MKTMKVSKEVKASASVVWGILIDLEGSVDTISGIHEVEILSDRGGFGVGTVWRETRTMFGKKATEEMEVTEVVDGASYVVVAKPDSANYTTVMAVVATGDSTSTVSMEFGADPKGTFTRVMGATVGKMFEGATKKMITQDLDDIAAAAEATV